MKQKSSSAPALNFQVNSKSEESGPFLSLRNDSIHEIFISVNPLEMKGDGVSSNKSEINEAIEVAENEKCYGNSTNNAEWDTSIPLCSEENKKEKLNHKRTIKQIFSHLLCSSFSE